jgi:hypothetical protein
MPDGGQIDGSRVRWIWENFEPGPDNDFSISLMQPKPWQSLKAARVAVQASPKDGQAWVDLCGTYYGLSYSGWHKNPGFGEVYPALGLEACQEAARLLPKSEQAAGQAWLGVCSLDYRLSMGEESDPTVALQACQQAARLLPDDAAPHYGLAILYLSALSNNPSQRELQPVLDELKIGQELEAAQEPSQAVYLFLPMFGMDASPVEYITDWVNRISTVPTATLQQPTRIPTLPALTSTPHPTSPNLEALVGPYSADSHTLLLLHLNGSNKGAQGEVGSARGIQFTYGRFDQGVLITGRDILSYPAADNLNRTKGAIEFWLCPNWNGDDERDYVFFEVGKNWYNRMRIMKDGANNLRFMLWDSQAEYGVAHNVSDWRTGEWHHVAATWQETDIALYVDGQKVDSSRNAHMPDSLGDTISIGSLSAESSSQANAIIDELRISDIPRLGDVEFVDKMQQPSPISVPTWKFTPTFTSAPSVTPLPKANALAPSTTEQVVSGAGKHGTMIGLLAILVILAIGAYLVLRKMRGRPDSPAK